MNGTPGHPRLLATKDNHSYRPFRGFLLTAHPAFPALAREGRPYQGSPTGLAGKLFSATGVSELALSISGVALATFMVMHLGLLSSVLLGTQSLDALATFIEYYYLLQVMAPFLILLLLIHASLTLRKVPATLRQQLVFLRQAHRLGHVDTWTWAVQLISGLALLIMASIHLWVVLSGLPIQAAKSAARVYSQYLWLYIPLLLFVESHITLGLYRVSAKWGLLSRHKAHVVFLLWSVVVLGLGFTILAIFYGLGGNP